MQRKVGTGWKSLDDTKFIDILNFIETIVIMYPPYKFQRIENRIFEIVSRAATTSLKIRNRGIR